MPVYDKNSLGELGRSWIRLAEAHERAIAAFSQYSRHEVEDALLTAFRDEAIKTEGKYHPVIIGTWSPYYKTTQKDYDRIDWRDITDSPRDGTPKPVSPRKINWSISSFIDAYPFYRGHEIRVLKNDFERWIQKTSANIPVIGVALAANSRSSSTSSRTRGRKPEVRNRVKAAMKRDLQNGDLSPEELFGMKEDALRARFIASRDTCRKARDEVLSELEFRQIATSDK